MSIISPNSVASGAHGEKVVEAVIVKKFTFAISSPDEFLVLSCQCNVIHVMAILQLTLTIEVVFMCIFCFDFH